MNYWDSTAGFDSHRLALRSHLAEIHGVQATMTCTPTRDIVKHLTEHHKPGTKTDEFFPYGEL